MRRDVKLLLSKDKNPFFEHGDARYFLAERDGAVVGRIAAITNRLHNETWNDKVGFFGFFETIDDQAVADALLDTATDWVRARGHDVLRGPASFSTNDECGLLVEGFDTPPTIMMPHNPPYYLALLERAGFHTAKNLLAFEGGNLHRVITPPERLIRGTELIQKRLGITIRPLDLKRFDAEVELIKRLYNAAWEKNWGFVPMTEHEIEHLAEAFRPVVVPDMVPFVEKDGEVIAFGLALPDLNEVFRKYRSGRLLPAALEVMWRVKTDRLTRSRILLAGILPAWRGRGLDAVLYYWIWTRAGYHNMGWGEAGWILEDNATMIAGAIKMNFTHYKTYRLLDRAV